jgi:hypothetical protein
MKGKIIWSVLFVAGAVCAQPVITEDPHSKAAVEGRRVYFSVQAEGSTPLHYQWQFNGTNISWGHHRTISFHATKSRAGNYNVLVRDEFGNVRSSSPALLEVQKRPVVLSQPRSKVVGEHQTAVFSVRLNDSGPYDYINWYHHSEAEPTHHIPPTAARGVNTFRLEIPDVNNNGTYNGLYWIVVTNKVGWKASRRASLNVVGPPRLTSEPQDRTVEHGHTARFRISIAPDLAGHKNVQWYHDGQPISGATSRTFRRRHVGPEDQGAYYCTVTSIGGTTTSFSAQLTVY